jgi:hypothetical protein
LNLHQEYNCHCKNLFNICIVDFFPAENLGSGTRFEPQGPDPIF